MFSIKNGRPSGHFNLKNRYSVGNAVVGLAVVGVPCPEPVEGPCPELACGEPVEPGEGACPEPACGEPVEPVEGACPIGCPFTSLTIKFDEPGLCVPASWTVVVTVSNGWSDVRTKGSAEFFT